MDYQPLSNLSTLKENDYSQGDLNEIRILITPPVPIKPMNSLDNSTNLNFVYVHNLLNLHLCKINEGGFSSIFLS